MEIYAKKNHPIASLFTRFIVGFGAGFLGMLVLGLILFLTWHIVGDYLQAPDQLTDALGNSIGQLETHSLFLSIVTGAVFASSMVTTLSYVFLSLLVEEHYTKRSTTLTHVFFGNVIFLLLFLPVYIAVNGAFSMTGLAVVSIFHAVVVCFFSVFVLQGLHQAKYTLVNLYGNLIGLLVFAFLFLVFLSDVDPTILLFLSFPLFMGVMGATNRLVELVYSFLYTKSGSDMLNIETTFGEDYGVPMTEKNFDEDQAFEEEFRV